MANGEQGVRTQGDANRDERRQWRSYWWKTIPGDVRLTREALKSDRLWNNLNVVRDGVEAMAYLRREGEFGAATRPDLILLDLNLPRKDGREVLAEIKADEDLKLHSGGGPDDLHGGRGRPQCVWGARQLLHHQTRRTCSSL